MYLHKDLLSHPRLKVTHPERGRLVRAGLWVDSAPSLQVALRGTSGTSVMGGFVICELMDNLVFIGPLLIPMVLAIPVALLHLVLLLLLLLWGLGLLPVLKRTGVFRRC